MTMLTNAATCRGVRKDGTPCQSQILDAAGYCFTHAPGNQGARLRQNRAAGGYAKSKAARAERLVPATLRPVLTRLLTALEECHDGSLDAKQASALAALAGAIVRVYQAGSLEERVQALEQATQEGERA